MPRQKYKLNTESLDFEIIKIPLRRKTQRLIVLFLVSIVLFFIYAEIYSRFFESPKIMLLKAQTTNIKLKYDLLLKDIENADKAVTEINNRDQNIYRTIFGLNKVSYAAGRKNTEIRKESLLSDFNKTFESLDKFRRKVYIQSKSFDVISHYAFDMEKLILCMPSIPPIDLKKVRSYGEFGWRNVHPVYKDSRMHSGLDFGTSVGTPIYVTGDGVVSRVAFSSSYGNVIDVDHGYGYITRYAHLSKTLVTAGQQIKRGDQIALSGDTGVSSGPHLHYEVQLYNKALNPRKFFINDSQR
ncbi:MAG: M23 family metallopeptidase [Prevotellaceae bacterium]|jgi:murein DD-endopeptidase MepM/ murein hydrolase activator NlpD|nr:M23 family metallopeptidase [Prevotellaceae bacterium]